MSDIETLANEAIVADNQKALDAAILAETAKVDAELNLGLVKMNSMKAELQAVAIAEKASNAEDFNQAALELRNEASSLFAAAEAASGDDSVM